MKKGMFILFILLLILIPIVNSALVVNKTDYLGKSRAFSISFDDYVYQQTGGYYYNYYDGMKNFFYIFNASNSTKFSIGVIPRPDNDTT
ncbi:MAG: hypothetical protein KJ623_02330, partial [Nanoarchaeota archaeon]|nr:hypothetical protein [Nanoarchaeota archaeon]